MASAVDDVVKAAAAELMTATATNHVAVSQRVLADLVRHFDVDSAFLRHTDHTIHATVLIAEWPPRHNIPHPDPIGVVYFTDADSVFAMIENRTVPFVLRPEPENIDYQQHVEEATGFRSVALAAVPLLSGEVTTGTLGCIKFGDREWLPEELNTLQAIATLFAQLQARIVAEEQALFLAEHDDLTGLLNRRALIARLDERLAKGRPGPVAVLFLDVDRFKVVNDHFGHDAGDRFIKAFAELLREAAEPQAAAARLGGDEIVMVLGEPMDLAAAEAFAQLLHKLAQTQIAVGGEVLTRTVSIGVAVGAPGRDTSSDLLRRADEAVMSAKNSGGNSVAVFDPKMSEKHAIITDVELHLEGFIERDSGALVVQYLPEFDMRTGVVLGAEALVRWRHPTRGLLMPASFIPGVESANLAGKLGRLVMHAACAEFSSWRSQGIGRDAVLHLNVSPAQLVTDGFVGVVAATLEVSGVDPDRVCLEITESLVISDIDTTRKTLSDLKQVGVRIAIDDFGTGYSSLTHLKSLPVDILKIDKEFVLNLGTDAADLVILRQVMSLASALGLGVIAEGVETPAAARTLLDLGCDRAQGFLLSRPLDGAAMRSLLNRRFVPMDF